MKSDIKRKKTTIFILLIILIFTVLFGQTNIFADFETSEQYDVPIYLTDDGSTEVIYDDGSFIGFGDSDKTATHAGVIEKFVASEFEHGISSVRVMPPIANLSSDSFPFTVKLSVYSFNSEYSDSFTVLKEIEIEVTDNTDNWYTIDFSDISLDGTKTFGIGYSADIQAFRKYHQGKTSSPKILPVYSGNSYRVLRKKTSDASWSEGNAMNYWLPCVFRYDETPEENFRFVCASDIHFDQGGFYKMTENDDSFVGTDGAEVNLSNEYRMQRLVDSLNEEYENNNFKFVIFNGDLITLHENGWSNPNDGNSDTLRTERLKLLFSKYLSQLKMPYYAIRGNHDEYTAEEWKEITGCETQFAIDMEGYKILCIDTYDNLNSTYDGEASVNTGVDAHLSWIDEQMEDAINNSQKVICVFHDLDTNSIPSSIDTEFYNKYCSTLNNALAFIVAGHTHKSETQTYGVKKLFHTGSFGHIPRTSLSSESITNDDGSVTTVSSQFFDYNSSEKFGFRVFSVSDTSYETYFVNPSYNYSWTDKFSAMNTVNENGEFISYQENCYSYDENGELKEGTRNISFEGNVTDKSTFQIQLSPPTPAPTLSPTPAPTPTFTPSPTPTLTPTSTPTASPTPTVPPYGETAYTDAVFDGYSSDYATTHDSGAITRVVPSNFEYGISAVEIMPPLASNAEYPVDVTLFVCALQSAYDSSPVMLKSIDITIDSYSNTRYKIDLSDTIISNVPILGIGCYSNEKCFRKQLFSGSASDKLLHDMDGKSYRVLKKTNSTDSWAFNNSYNYFTPCRFFFDTEKPNPLPPSISADIHLSQLQNTLNITLKTEVNSDEPQKYALTAVYYNSENSTVRIKNIAEGTFSSTDTSQNYCDTIPTDAAYAKVFVWDSLDSMTPIGNFARTDFNDRRDEHLRMAVLSDIHVGSDESDWSGLDPDGRIQLLVDSILAEHKKKPIHAILITGDIVADPDHYNYFKTWLNKFVPQLEGIPVYYARGNHDRFSDATWDELTDMPIEYSFSSDKYSFVVLDSYPEYTNSTPPCHEVDENDLAFIDKQRVQQNNKKAFIVSHYFPDVQSTSLIGQYASENEDVLGLFYGHSHVFNNNKMKGGYYDMQTGSFYRPDYTLPTLDELNNGKSRNLWGWRMFEEKEDCTLHTYQVQPAHYYPYWELDYPYTEQYEMTLTF